MSESSVLIKSAPHLNYKTLFPTSFERQKVCLVTNIFNNTTISALEKHNLLGTAYFVRIIYTWWSAVNVKRPLTHIIKHESLTKSYTDVLDDRLIFF